ncbi:cell division protein FtsZ [Pararoseomonas indoligenes]|uniref:Cell division protein FtsZ n=1 Tax=Roseomonas indoligenes TaxID=2820811 RepID=A0A940MXJ2_9PROT|nr:cell division protein FtsZ [Pararoseomonas indoligenes]MBP0493523.1 cell division protein FtsZ [Pararoseomonas indoligenes]
MTLNLTIPRQQHTDFTPRITVIGVGGAGCNAVNNMIGMGLDGVEFLVANTDAQQLVNSRAERRVQLGPHLTQGLGAGAKPEIGRAAAEEATEDLARHLEGVHMIFITAGMGGGTGTGAAPVIARMARERGVLTVGVVTKPFDFEGPKRRRSAEQGLEELQQYVDTLIIVPNQNLFRKANERTTFAEAFKMADDVLYMGVRGVSDLMTNPGLVNLDFADIRTVMAEMGKAMMGTGEAEGDDRAVKAAEAAISNPLLEDTSMRGARGVLINITGGYDMTLFEVDEAANRIRREVDEDANIIFGTSVDETLNGRLRLSVVATGIDAVSEAKQEVQAEAPRVVAIGGGAAVAAQPAGFVPGAPQAPAMRPAVVQPGAGRPAPVIGASRMATVAPVQSAPIGAPVVAPAPNAGPRMPMAMRRATVETGSTPMEPVAEAPAPAPMAPVAAPPLNATPASRVAQAPQAPSAAPAGGLGGIFRRATGIGGMRRTLPEQGEAPQAAPAAPAQRPQAQEDGMGLDIPTFLRRQGN